VAGGSCVRCAGRNEEEEKCGNGTLQVRAADKEPGKWSGTLASLSSAAAPLLLPSCPCFVESMGGTRAELAASASWRFPIRSEVYDNDASHIA
jgi:hypothetical protein